MNQSFLDKLEERRAQIIRFTDVTSIILAAARAYVASLRQRLLTTLQFKSLAR